jgi:hypothetical protein
MVYALEAGHQYFSAPKAHLAIAVDVYAGSLFNLVEQLLHIHAAAAKLATGSDPRLPRFEDCTRVPGMLG